MKIGCHQAWGFNLAKDSGVLMPTGILNRAEQEHLAPLPSELPPVAELQGQNK